MSKVEPPYLGAAYYPETWPSEQIDQDIALMKEQYELIECQPVDMFPHTQHVENIALLGRKIPLIK